MLDMIVGNAIFYMIIGMVVGALLKWARDYVKTTSTPYDDLGVESLIVLLNLADKYFDEPLFDNLFQKAKEILDKEPETPETFRLKEAIKPIVKN